MKLLESTAPDTSNGSVHRASHSPRPHCGPSNVRAFGLMTISVGAARWTMRGVKSVRIMDAH